MYGENRCCIIDQDLDSSSSWFLPNVLIILLVNALTLLWSRGRVVGTTLKVRRRRVALHVDALDMPQPYSRSCKYQFANWRLHGR